MCHTLCANRIIYIHGIGIIVPVLLGSLVLSQPCLPILFKALGKINKCLGAEL